MHCEIFIFETQVTAKDTYLPLFYLYFRSFKSETSSTAVNLNNVEVEFVRQAVGDSTNPKIDTLINTEEKNKDTDFAQVNISEIII